MKYLHYLLSLTLAATTAFVVACSDDSSEDGPKQEAEHNDFVNANDNHEGASYVLTEANVNSSKFASLIEMPKLQQGDVFIVHQATDMKGKPVNFSVAYDSKVHHSRWVAFRFDSQMKASSVARKDNNSSILYPRDPLCKDTPSSDASFHGYDHGHLCASADRVCSRVANDQTFYMSNMSPQQASFNRDYWTLYEEYVRNLGRSCGVGSGSNPSFADTLYVVKGGAIRNAVTTTKVDNYNMPVPTHYFIALLSVKNGNYAAMGFWIEHRQYDLNIFKSVKTELSAHAVSIDRLEALTGIDFFCNLPGAIEKAVESNFVPSVWFP